MQFRLSPNMHRDTFYIKTQDNGIITTPKPQYSIIKQISKIKKRKEEKKI